MAGKHTRGQGTVFKRGKWYHVCYSVNGQTFRESARTTNEKEAIAYLHRKQGKLASGEALTPDRTKIKDLLRLVLQDYESRNKKIYIESLRVERHLNPFFGELQASRFSSSKLEAYIRERSSKAKPSTINRELALLRRGFKLGYRNDPPLIGRVPHIRILDESGNVRTGFLKPEHYQALLEELPEELKLLLVFGYHVGMRRGALLEIKWKQVDLSTGVVWIEVKGQNRKPVPVAIPIYGDMRQYLERQPKQSEYLFARGSQPIKDFRGSWRSACERAGLPELIFHDLRRTAARNLIRAGVPESVAMKITGHKTRTMFSRYNIIDIEDVKEAGKKVELFLKLRANEQRETE
jgi:integrase